MAFKKINPEPEYSRYWRPQAKGDYIEGWIVDSETDPYNNKQIVLKVGENDEGKDLLTTLPSHKNLRRFYHNLKDGYYIRVEVTKEIELNNGNNMFIYSVGIDPEKSISN